MTELVLTSTTSVSRSSLRSKRYRRLQQGVYVESTASIDLNLRVRAALTVQPDAVVCGRTAAVLHGLPVDDDGVVHLVRTQTSPRSRRSELRIHRLDVATDEIAARGGVRVTTPTRTLTDLANELTLEELVVLGDAVARRCGREALDEAARRSWGRPGVQRLREAVRISDPGSDSPAETRMRLRLHAAGFVGLRHGAVVRDAAGGWLAAPDLADEHARVAVQHDGFVHFTDARRRRNDVARDELCRAAGWEVVVSTAVDDRNPAELVGKVAAAYLRSARQRGAHVLPRCLREAA